MFKYHLASSSEEDGLSDSILEDVLLKKRSCLRLLFSRVGLICIGAFLLIACLVVSIGSGRFQEFQAYLPIDAVQAYLPNKATFPYSYGSHRDSIHDHPLNATLGFGKIYVLNLPARIDKRLEMTILAQQYNLSIEFIDGVDGRANHPDFSEDFQGKSGVSDGHARAWQHFLESGYETALIFEDDVDFDVRLRQQLVLLQGPLATYLSMVQSKTLLVDAKDPWNHKSWEILWLGSEKDVASPLKSSPPEPSKHIPYLTYEDSTVTEVDQYGPEMRNIFDQYKLRLNGTKQNLRVIKKPYDAWGLQGYAMTRIGAQRCLYWHAHDMGFINHIDFKIANLIYAGYLRGYTIIPPLFSQFEGPIGKDSDRVHHIGRLPSEDGHSIGIEQSAKQRLAKDIGMAKSRLNTLSTSAKS